MKIRYYGHSCFALISNNGTVVFTDPYTGVGYELPSGLTADVVTLSHAHFDHNYTQAVQAQRVISQTGAYQIADVSITGKESFHDEKQGALRGKNILFTIEIDGLKICHLGDLGEPYSVKLAEKIEGADILLLPVGGTYTIDARQAKEYVLKCNAKVIIPMHYKPSDGRLDIAGAEEFLQLFQEDELIRVPNGETQIEKTDVENARKIIYMERIRR